MMRSARRLCRRRGREGRFRGRCCRRFGFLRSLRPHRFRPWRGAGRPEFREYRTGLDNGGGGRGEVAGIADHLDRNSDRLEPGQVEGHGETGIRCLDRYGAGGFAARAQRGRGVRPRRRGFELNRDQLRRRLEVIERRKRRAAGKQTGEARSGDGNRENTTYGHHSHLRRSATIPDPDHRSVRTGPQPYRADSLKDG
jgi:hypothetical protein